MDVFAVGKRLGWGLEALIFCPFLNRITVRPRRAHAVPALCPLHSQRRVLCVSRCHPARPVGLHLHTVTTTTHHVGS